MNLPAHNGDAALLGATHALTAAAEKIGLICAHCGEELPADIAPAGWEYLLLRPLDDGGRIKVRARQSVICARQGCAEARTALDEASTARRPVMVAWTMLGEETPPTRAEHEPKPLVDRAPGDPLDSGRGK